MTDHEIPNTRKTIPQLLKIYVTSLAHNEEAVFNSPRAQPVAADMDP